MGFADGLGEICLLVDLQWDGRKLKCVFKVLSTKMEKITGMMVEAGESDVQNKGMNMSH